MLKIYDESNADALIAKLRERAECISPQIMRTVGDVIADVKARGDDALREYTERFDKVKMSGFYLSDEEKAALIAKVPQSLRHTIERAAENIYAFHERQKQSGYIISEGGRVMGQRVIPLGRVGLYVPGGTAAYPSSVLMNAIPAKVAGVSSIVMVTPPKTGGISPAVVYAAKIAGVDEIVTVGGAQAVAALAYGTQSIARVDKIVGPGNIYVAMAKKLLYGTVDIDMIAGPSEVLVIADEGANPRYIAADLMSQAEHDPLAASVLVTTSVHIAKAVCGEIERQIELLPRKETISKSLQNYGAAVVVGGMKKALEISNEIAPEHLELAVRSPFDLLGGVKNAGSVFLGDYAPEPLGDYFAGPNHVLPTNGTARFASPLSVDSFVKKSSYIYYSREELEAVRGEIADFALAEGLGAHANSISIRFGE